jgi:hypothetical protein
MAAKYYAWTELNLGDESIAPGTIVTEKMVGDDFDSFVECGAIRTKVFPKMPNTWKGSVRSFRQEQIRALRAGLDARDLLDLDDGEDEGDSEFLELLASVEEGASE